MSKVPSFGSEFVPLAILRIAAWLVPGQRRQDWLAEWKSELWYVQQRGDRQATRFCWGAFHDALWLTMHTQDCWKKRPLESPVVCICFLALIASVSLFVALRLPGARELMLPSPYPEARKLALISTDRRFPVLLPSVPVAKFQLLKNNAKSQFAGLAFYRPFQTRVETAPGQIAELSVALASRNLFELLSLPIVSSQIAVEHPTAPALVLNGDAWRKYFDSDPHIVGRTLDVAGRRAVAFGVMADSLWHLPGQMDGWLLDGEGLNLLPPHATGFVLGQLTNFPLHSRWRLSVPVEENTYEHFRCASLSRRHLVFGHLFTFFISLLILPSTTSVKLGEYPAASLRRWVFLALKFILVTVIVFCGILDVAAITSTPIQPHGLLVGYVLAFRWAMSDQRKRCPVCLRLLTSPVRIGWSSQTLLAWYGTEFMCDRGHGLLHVPEIPTSYSTQRWLHLDQSWSDLFAPRDAGGIR